MIRAFLIIFIIQFSSRVLPNEIDSLKTLLNVETQDTSRFRIYKELFLKLIKSDYKEALHYAKLKHKIALQYPQKFDLAETYQHIGYCFSYLAKNDSAIFYLNKGLLVKKENPDMVTASISSILAGVYFDISDYQKAIDLYLQSLKISEKTGDTVFAYKTYSQIANPYIEMGYYDKAEEYLNKSVTHYAKKNDLRTLLVLYNNLGNLFSYKSDYKKSIEYFLKCLDISKKIGHKLGEAYSLSNLGESHNRLGDYQNSLSYLLQSEVIFKEENFIAGLAGIKSSIGSAYIKLRKPAEAKTYLYEALKIAKEQELKRYIKSIYKDLSELYETTGDNSNALKYFKLHSDMKDSIYNEEKSKQIADSRIKFETEKVEQELKFIRDQKELQDLRLSQQENKINEQRFFITGSIIATIILVIIITLIFVLYRFKQRERYNELARDHLEISLRFLRSQLNPHFIFNALSSIQGLILEKNITDANKYLGKFAILLRGILENTSTSKILLSEEMKNSELYLELEQMRHNMKFTFTIETDEEIDADDILIPPMILQPILENAIKHGLSKLSGNGKIVIRIFKKDGLLNFEIIDNGVGLIAAELAKIGKTYKSMGLQLVKDRLAKQYASLRSEEILTFVDLSREDENASGTKVILQIPFEEKF